MVKIACLLADGFEESEAIVVVDLLRRAHFTVDLVSINQPIVSSARNIKIVADKGFEDMDDYDMIFLPGGGVGAENLAKDERVLNLLQNYAKKDKYLSAICAAPTVLGKAGVLANKKATSHPSMKVDPRMQGVDYREESVVQDGRVLTSRGVGTTLDFALALVRVLGGDDQAIAKAIVYTKAV